MDKHISMLSLTGATIDTLLDDKTKDMVMVARATKAAGCLLSALTRTDSEVARQEVRAELKELRAYVGAKQEEKLIHPVLWAKVQAILKGVVRKDVASGQEETHWLLRLHCCLSVVLASAQSVTKYDNARFWCVYAEHPRLSVLGCEQNGANQLPPHMAESQNESANSPMSHLCV
eukprot:2797856-Amphidinium_carterae.1